jgi:tetratricopeptide (TPR) repeat protein
VALDASALGGVSQPQIVFNPAFQNVVLHEARVWRDGQGTDRLADARIELMRREQRLEQQVIDGAETLMVVLNDVRVGDPVEVSYTIEGDNPIYEDRISTGLQLAWDSPVALLHQRFIAPAGRPLQVRPVASDVVPEQFTEGGLQVIRVVRSSVPAVVPEQATPPWFKVYPAIEITEYRSWAEVDAWAGRLFAQPAQRHPAVVERAAAFRAGGLSGAALASEVLRFVQDEVRYFSVSLGESSHRPRPPERTLAERLGDCKDKAVLLVALLQELGFDARPALVSTMRTRALGSYLPSHDLFDHVIVRLELDGRSHYLDATLSSQGTSFATRGVLPFGAALVVGAGDAIQPITLPADALDALEFEQRWDLSRPGRPTTLVTVLRASGLAAERWRNLLAMAGEERVADAIAGVHTRLHPGLKPSVKTQLRDDRARNVLELTQRFEAPDFGHYGNGGLEADFIAIELADQLVGPAEPHRHTPFHFDGVRSATSRIVVTAPRPPAMQAPPGRELGGRHFRLSTRVEVNGAQVGTVRRFERRSDEVLPGDLEAFRDQVLKARQQLGGRLRLALVDMARLAPEFDRIESRVRSEQGGRADTLTNILLRNEASRLLAARSLEVVEPGSRLAARILAVRAEAGNLLGDFGSGLADAEAALAIAADNESAREARAVALLGLGRAEEALAVFLPLRETGRRIAASKWVGALHFALGRDAEAQAALREAIDGGSGDDRDFALLWLYLAAERQGGRGAAAVEPYLAGADTARLPGALLHHLAGRIDREAVLRVVRESPEMQRLNEAEFSFFIGQQHAARGQSDEALQWMRRTVETRASPYRELSFARLALQRAGNK